MKYFKNIVTLSFRPEECRGCGMCLVVCPHNVFMRTNGKIDIADRDACMECGACQQNCPHGALAVRSGVGCAISVVNQMLGRKHGCCTVDNDCSDLSSQCS